MQNNKKNIIIKEDPREYISSVSAYSESEN